MSDFGVYDDEMLNTRFSDQDIDRLLSGRTPEDEDLAGLAPILEALHRGDNRSISEERIARIAAQTAELATTRPTTARERTTTRSRRPVLALRQKMATGLAAALLLSGMTGVAVASNGAAPGDPLYGLDRALEAFGIGDGGAAERIAEAQALFNRGQIAEAVAHAAEAVEVTQVEGDSEIEANLEAITSEALLTAAERLQTNTDGSEEAIAGRTNVALLLEYMATTEDTGDDFGEGVAALARQISGESNESADNGADNADNATAGADNADNADKESEDAGPPSDAPSGPPDSIPPSNTTGRP